MLATVDWTGDGDDTDFAVAIERIFDLRLPSEVPWTTFGEMHRHVAAHIKRRGGGGSACATQMALYRLRRALRLGRHVRPDVALGDVIGKDVRACFIDLAADTDLAMPATRAGRLGVVGVCCFVTALALGVLTNFPPSLRILLAAVAGHAGMWLRHMDRRRLPYGCATLGDLAREVSAMNRGCLARDGARLTDGDIWRIIQEAAALESGVDPELIGPETTFFRSRTQAA